MSQFVQHYAQQFPVLLRRPTAWLIGAVLVAALAITIPLVVVSSGSDSSRPSSQPVTQSIGGPNEDLRGAAAAEAVGASTATPVTGGPNETLRGKAVHSATRSP